MRKFSIDYIQSLISIGYLNKIELNQQVIGEFIRQLIDDQDSLDLELVELDYKIICLHEKCEQKDLQRDLYKMSQRLEDLSQDIDIMYDVLDDSELPTLNMLLQSILIEPLVMLEKTVLKSQSLYINLINKLLSKYIDESKQIQFDFQHMDQSSQQSIIKNGKPKKQVCEIQIQTEQDDILIDYIDMLQRQEEYDIRMRRLSKPSQTQQTYQSQQDETFKIPSQQSSIQLSHTASFNQQQVSINNSFTMPLTQKKRDEKLSQKLQAQLQTQKIFKGKKSGIAKIVPTYSWSNSQRNNQNVVISAKTTSRQSSLVSNLIRQRCQALMQEQQEVEKLKQREILAGKIAIENQRGLDDYNICDRTSEDILFFD
ncbi:UNKNOWN [Stylonychia lemnae]|uniref:Uncharacterized protein n=1 Tax=Stylonychia lemnae TaxID=5949 RepID=A0A078ADF5_STYLE|nr:UNKNOWN [Stylonychia lemnae]|eukprot:CDW80280.1 UNKNOWN [Stylonychia lemnae]